MTVKLLIELKLECLSLNEAAQSRLSLHLSKCHIVEHHMFRLINIWPAYEVLVFIASPETFLLAHTN